MHKLKVLCFMIFVYITSRSADIRGPGALHSTQEWRPGLARAKVGAIHVDAGPAL